LTIWAIPQTCANCRICESYVCVNALAVPANVESVVARDKNKSFHFAVNVSGISKQFDLPRQPKKLRVETRDWPIIEVGGSFFNSQNFSIQPSPGAEFLLDSLSETVAPAHTLRVRLPGTTKYLKTKNRFHLNLSQIATTVTMERLESLG
jgi:hypothetical protein